MNLNLVNLLLCHSQLSLMIFERFGLAENGSNVDEVGVRKSASWFAHARTSARPPIDMSGNFPAHVSAKSPSKISPKVFVTLGQLFKIFPFSAQKSHSAGGRGSLNFFGGWNPNIFDFRTL